MSEEMNEEVKNAVIETIASLHGSFVEAQDVAKKMTREITQAKTKEVAIMAFGFVLGNFLDCVEGCNGKAETDSVLEGMTHSANIILSQMKSAGKMFIEMRIVRRGDSK